MQPWALAKRFWQVAGPAAIENYPDIETFAMWQALLLHVAGRRACSSSQPSSIEVAVPRRLRGAAEADVARRGAVGAARSGATRKRELTATQPLARNFIAALLALLSQPTRTAARRAHGDAERRVAARGDARVSPPTKKCCTRGRSLFRDHLDSRRGVSATLKAAGAAAAPGRVRRRRHRHAGRRPVRHRPRRARVLGLTARTARPATRRSKRSSAATSASIVAQLARAAAEHRAASTTASSSSRTRNGRRARPRVPHARSTSTRTGSTPGSPRSRPSGSTRCARRAPQGMHIGAFGVVEDLLPDSARPADQARRQPRLRARAVAAAGGDRRHPAQRPPRQPPGGRRRVQHRPALAPRQAREAAARRPGQRPVDGGAARLSLRARAARQRACRSTSSTAARYPLRPAGTRRRDEAQEAIAARDVDRRRAPGRRVPRATAGQHRRRRAGARAGAPSRARSAASIDDLLDQMDSVADLLLAESVFQIAGGNMDGAGAAMLTLDKQQRPPETRVRRHAAQHARLHAARGGRDAERQRSARGPASRRRPGRASSSRGSTPGWRALLGDPVELRLRRARASARSLGTTTTARRSSRGTTRATTLAGRPHRARPVAARARARQRGAAGRRAERGAGADRRACCRRRRARAPAPSPTHEAIVLQRRVAASAGAASGWSRSSRSPGCCGGCSRRPARCAAWTWSGAETASRPTRR